MSFRPASRLFASLRPAFRQQQQQPSLLFRRRVATGVPTGPNPATEQTGFAKLWNSPVGPKTVHFWAPIMKWALVLAGVSDFTRPAESLSLTQNLALMSTGAIWTRWCFVIRPKNMFLASVNFFLFLVASTQVTRILMWQRSVKAAGKEVEGEVKSVGEELKSVEGKAEKAVKS